MHMLQSGTHQGSQAPDLYYAAAPAGAKARRQQQRRARQKAVRAARTQAQSAEAPGLHEQSSAGWCMGTEATVLDYFSHGRTVPLNRTSPIPAEGWPQMPEPSIGSREPGEAGLMAKGMTVPLSNSPLVQNEGWPDVQASPAAEMGWPDLADKQPATQASKLQAFRCQGNASCHLCCRAVSDGGSCGALTALHPDRCCFCAEKHFGCLGAAAIGPDQGLQTAAVPT